MRWAVAVKRVTATGSLWVPNVGARVCEYHFIAGAPGKDPFHVDYTPTVFWHDDRAKGALRQKWESFKKYRALSKKRSFSSAAQQASAYTVADPVADTAEPDAIDTDANTVSEGMDVSVTEQPIAEESAACSETSVVVQTDNGVCVSCVNKLKRIQELEGKVKKKLRQHCSELQKKQQGQNLSKFMGDTQVRFYTDEAAPTGTESQSEQAEEC
ncbi:hypothetical protein HPB51_010251 [Rhipicephalus microplus]|uniref:THAP-type domain-containing protein n=1 Tax=Rhipicephalus microplus TaxID=6941 RepID=A0A9J6D4T9_RHIMP|nr:hypothetical protein HPB51_010251 [Rhipicephalus microplus]